MLQLWLARQIFGCVKVHADQAPPDLTGWFAVFAGAASGFDGHRSRLIRGEVAKQLTSKLRVRSWISGTAAGASGEDRTLSQVGIVSRCGKAQATYFLPVSATCVSTRQTHSAPQVTMPRIRKGCNRTGDPINIGAANEPQAAAESLIEGPQLVTSEPLRPRGSVCVSWPMKITFVKTIAVEGEPAQNRI